MTATGLLSLEDAYRAIDVDTVALLLGMMIVVANIRLSGFFLLVSNWTVARAGIRCVLLAAVILLSGFFSAFLVNDAICLVLTPLVLDFVTRLRRNPIPYLLAVAMASNVGSTATITGNPQNIMIGSFAQIPYATFSGALWRWRPRAAPHPRADRNFLPSRVLDEGPAPGRASSHARASPAYDQISCCYAPDGGRVSRGSATGQGGADRRCLSCS